MFFMYTAFLTRNGLVLAGFILAVNLFSVQMAEAATLSITPESGSYQVGATISATVTLNTSGVAVTDVDLNALTYNPSLLDVLDENAGISGVQIMPGSLFASTTRNSVDTTAGRITFSTGIIPGGTGFTGQGTLATIRFRVKTGATGQAQVAFETGSTKSIVVSNAANVLTSSPGATYTLTPATPTDSQNPTVNMTSPANDATVSGTSVPFFANATDDIGVVGVQFRRGTTNILPEITVPDTDGLFKMWWNSTLVSDGTYTLTAIARDASGKTTTSGALTVYVNNAAPSTKFSINDRVYMNTGSVNIRATPNGTILGTQALNIVGTVISDTTYTSPTAAGGHTWWKVNFDTGLDGWVAEQYLTDYVPPAFNFSLSNGGNRTVTQGQTVTNSITTTLTSGPAQSVSFSASGLPSGVSASFSPSSCIPNTTCPSTLTLTASAGASLTSGQTVTITGTSGGLTRTTTFTLTVSSPAADTTKPSVSITVPGSGVNVSGSLVTLSASASDIGAGGGAGTVSKVEFFIDGTKVGEDTTASLGSYSITWDSFTTTNGNKVFLVTATDAAGLTQNDSRSITVNNVLSNKFIIGDQVSVNANGINIRSGAGTNFGTNGTHNIGDIGNVLGGPVFATGYWWWNLSFSVGAGGWMAEDYLNKYTSPVATFDFSLQAEGAKTVGRGGSATETITVTKIGSASSQAVVFSSATVTGLPSGVTASVNPSNCTPNTTCSITITLSASGSAAVVSGQTVTVTATSGSLTRTTSFPLSVTAPASFDFTLTSGSPLSVARTQSVTTTFGTTLSSGGSQTVTFSATNLPSGVTASFTPSSCSPSCSTTLTLSASSMATLVSGQTVTITASGGSVSKIATVALTVTAQPDTQAPTVPGNFTATAASATQVNLSWSASTDDVGVTGYRIYKDGTILPQTTTQTTYQVTALSGNTVYRFQVEAYDQSGKTSRSLERTVTTPSAPDTTSPTITISSPANNQNVSGSITVTATASDTGGSGLAGVQFKVDGQSIGAEDTTSPYSTLLNTTSLTNGVHQITATARDGTGNNTTASVSVTVNNVVADTTAPQINGIVESAITTSGVTISFTADEQSIFLIRYWVSGSSGVDLVADIDYKISHQYTISGLLPNTNYQYDIILYDRARNLTQSNARSFKTLALTVPDTIPPPAITSLQLLNRSARSATVLWVSPQDTGGSQNSGKVSSYSLAYAGFNLTDANWSNARFAGGLPSPANPGVTQTYTIVDLLPNTTYSIAIRSKDSANLESDISNIVNLTTLAENTESTVGGSGGGTVGDNVPPGQVRDPKVKEFDRQISLSWENPTDADFVRTVIIRKEGSTPASRSDGVKVYEGNGTDLSDVYLENNKEYFYALFAVDLSSNYSAATTISARPKAGATQATEVGTKPTLTNTPTPPTTNPGGAGTLLVKGPFAVGYRTEEVKILQTLLASDPSVYPEALVTGYYGEATVRAVQKFQSKYGIISSGSPTTTGYGLAGPATRAKINEVLGSGGAGRIVTVPGVGQVDLDNITAEQQTLIINTLQQIILDLTKQIATLISARVN